MIDIPPEDAAAYWCHRPYIGRNNVKFNPNADQPKPDLPAGSYDVNLDCREKPIQGTDRTQLNIWFDVDGYARCFFSVREEWQISMKLFRRLCEESGLRDKYEAGQVDPSDIRDKFMRVTVDENGRVSDFAATAAAPAATPDADDIPF